MSVQCSTVVEVVGHREKFGATCEKNARTKNARKGRAAAPRRASRCSYVHRRADGPLSSRLFSIPLSLRFGSVRVSHSHLQHSIHMNAPVASVHILTSARVIRTQDETRREYTTLTTLHTSGRSRAQVPDPKPIARSLKWQLRALSAGLLFSLLRPNRRLFSTVFFLEEHSFNQRLS